MVGCKPGPEQSQEIAAQGLYSASISTDGNLLTVGSIYHGGSLWSGDERLFNWNHKSGEMTELVAVDFSPESQWAVTAAARSFVLWSARNGKASAYLSTPAQVTDIALGPNGNYALVGTTNNDALLYSPRQQSVVRELPHSNSVRSVAISGDGRLGLTGSEDANATVWDLQTGNALHRKRHNDEVQLVALSPDGRLALSAAQYDKALLWRTRSGDEIGKLPISDEKIKRGKLFTAAQFSAKGDQLLTGTSDQEVQLWNTRKLTLLAEWRLPKRHAWQPTGAAVIAVGFDRRSGMYHAVTANGFSHILKR
ncbi:hypothetical protein R50071_01730 [Halioxenophilus aromaticivorans]